MVVTHVHGWLVSFGSRRRMAYVTSLRAPPPVERLSATCPGFGGAAGHYRTAMRTEICVWV